MSLSYDSRFRPLERTDEGRESTSKTRDRTLRNGIIVALIGALVAGAFGFWYTGPKAIGAVDDPYGYEQQDGLHAGEVPRAIIITGWILVRPDADQPNVFITVTNKSDDGAYIVELVTADANAAATLNDFVDHQLATSSTGIKNYPGSTDARTIATKTLHRSAAVQEKLDQPKASQTSLGCERR